MTEQPLTPGAVTTDGKADAVPAARWRVEQALALLAGQDIPPREKVTLAVAIAAEERAWVEAERARRTALRTAREARATQRRRTHEDRIRLAVIGGLAFLALLLALVIGLRATAERPGSAAAAVADGPAGIQRSTERTSVGEKAADVPASSAIPATPPVMIVDDAARARPSGEGVSLTGLLVIGMLAVVVVLLVYGMLRRPPDTPPAPPGAAKEEGADNGALVLAKLVAAVTALGALGGAAFIALIGVLPLLAWAFLKGWPRWLWAIGGLAVGAVFALFVSWPSDVMPPLASDGWQTAWINAQTICQSVTSEKWTLAVVAVLLLVVARVAPDRVRKMGAGGI